MRDVARRPTRERTPVPALIGIVVLSLPAGARATPRLLEVQLRATAIEELMAGGTASGGDEEPAEGAPERKRRDRKKKKTDPGSPGSRGPPASTGTGARPAAQPKEEPAKPPALSAQPRSPLDFDLLGAPKAAPPPVDEAAMRARRTMLDLHQGLGFGLVGLQVATTVVGQLNYLDRFAGGPSTGKYQQTHAVLAYSTLGVFALNGAIAVLAPMPFKRNDGLDRVTLHKIGMYTAAAGMLTQGILGVVTREREGYLNQQSLATAHLVVGYVTFAAVAFGVGALIF